MNTYLRRSAKYLLYYAVMFCLIVGIVFYTSDRADGATVMDFFKEGSEYNILIFFVVFAGIYPALGFSKKEIYVTNLKEKEKEIIELFQNANFVLESQSATTMKFTLRNKFLRIMRVYEDGVTINFSENPVVIDGMRKDVLRFSRGIEYICQKGEE